VDHAVALITTLAAAFRSGHCCWAWPRRGFSVADLLSVRKIALPGAVVQMAVATALGTTLLLVAAFVALMLLVGRRFFPWLLWQVTRTGSRELFTLCVVAAAVSIAYGSARLFGVSFALGAFFAGMVLRESQFSQRAAEETLPLSDAFAVLFFVSVGMLIDPRVLVDQPLRVAAVVAIIVLGKSLAAAALVLLLRYPLNTALTVSASLAQIGEFSFILAGLGVALGLLPVEGQNLILAGALISIAFNPLLFAAIEPLQRWLRAHSSMAHALERRDELLAELPQSTDRRFLTNQVVLVGYGRVGRRIAGALQDKGVPFVVADENRESNACANRARPPSSATRSNPRRWCRRTSPTPACWSLPCRSRSRCDRWWRRRVRSIRTSRWPCAATARRRRCGWSTSASASSSAKANWRAR
jgi:Sodium/hydrogen exchanger family